jgi:hypothetical protein
MMMKECEIKDETMIFDVFLVFLFLLMVFCPSEIQDSTVVPYCYPEPTIRYRYQVRDLYV